MKIKYIKILILLICFYLLNIFGIIKNINFHFLERINFRYLLDSNNNYDKTERTYKNGLESIENCEKSDYNYFFEYITGHDVTFDKKIDTDRAVSNYK